MILAWSIWMCPGIHNAQSLKAGSALRAQRCEYEPCFTRAAAKQCTAGRGKDALRSFAIHGGHARVP